MRAFEDIKNSIGDLARIELSEGGVVVSTHCLYPSRGAVPVIVRGHIGDRFVVSDAGGAIDEAKSSGLRIGNPPRAIGHLVRQLGLEMDGASICSPIVPIEAVPAYVLIVANASKEASHWLLDHWKAKAVRNFKEDLGRLLEHTFLKEVKFEEKIYGSSTKAYKFDFVVNLGGGKKLLIDAVYNEASSIYARAIANLDVTRAENANLVQRMVYDDREDWDASNLVLLQVGAPVVPFSEAPSVIERIKAAS